MRNTYRALSAWLCLVALLSSSATGQQPFVERPHTSILWRPYEPTSLPATRLTNSERVHSLMRAGKLYLTVQDAIALAIENNLNLEVARFGPLFSEWAVERAQAGGAPRGVPSAAGQVAAPDPGLGVLGNQGLLGISSGSGGVGGNSGGGVSISQIGTTAVNLDPVVSNSTSFAHITQPQYTEVLSETSALVDTQHIYGTQIQEAFPFGGYVRLRSYDQYLKENSASDTLNPAEGADIDFLGVVYFLQNRGPAVNTRGIKVAKNNRIVARETFRSQLQNLVTSVLNLYWDLASADEVLKSRQNAVEVARKFRDDTQKEIGLGALAPVEQPRADAELAARQQDLVLAQQAVQQQGSLLKENLVRQMDPEIEAATIVPLDSIQVPEQDDLPPLRELAARAMAKRPDMAIAKVKDENSDISSVGTTNALLPTGIAYTREFDRAATGTPQVAPGTPVTNKFFVGGYGNALGQIFRHDFPTEYGGFYFQAPIGNRGAQADYGVEQLQLKQGDLSSQRDQNGIVVEISNQMIALRQARARYSLAVNTRQLSQQLLEAEQNRFSFGTSNFNNLVVVQRALLAAQTSEIAAQTAYAHARVALDQVLGETLDVTNVSYDEGLTGQVGRESTIPATVEPQQK